MTTSTGPVGLQRLQPQMAQPLPRARSMLQAPCPTLQHTKDAIPPDPLSPQPRGLSPHPPVILPWNDGIAGTGRSSLQVHSAQQHKERACRVPRPSLRHRSTRVSNCLFSQTSLSFFCLSPLPLRTTPYRFPSRGVKFVAAPLGPLITLSYY